jgi:hypothetical protein
MQPPSSHVGGAQVLRWSAIDERHRPSGGCRHIVAGVPQGPAIGLAICRYDGESSFYLFGCDVEWAVVTDSWHETLEDAMAQAEFEYAGVSQTWNLV